MKKGHIWIVGATSRIGRALAARLIDAGLIPVLVGRDKLRLKELSESLSGGPPMVTVGSIQAMAEMIAKNYPSVVVNTIGPFMETALTIAKACPAGTHYIDLSNAIFSVVDVLGLHEGAVASNQTFVTGAGYGPSDRVSRAEDVRGAASRLAGQSRCNRSG